MKMMEAGDTIVITNTSEEERKNLLALADNKPVPPSLLPTTAVAQICGCHPKSVTRWAKAGFLRQIHIGPRKIMYDAAEVAEFARTGTKTQSTEGAMGQQPIGELVKSNSNGGAA